MLRPQIGVVANPTTKRPGRTAPGPSEPRAFYEWTGVCITYGNDVRPVLAQLCREGE